jgi:hypothetical protein
VRFKNFAREVIAVPVVIWTHPKGGQIVENLLVEPGEISQEFDESDPIVQRMLKVHPELRPVVLATAWQRILDGVL